MSKTNKPTQNYNHMNNRNNYQPKGAIAMSYMGHGRDMVQPKMNSNARTYMRPRE